MEVVSIPIDKVNVSSMNIRANEYFGDDEDSELEENIESLGLLQPIVVRPIGDRFEVIVGRRRYLSVKNSGASEITCIVRDLSDEEALDASLSENIFRKSVDPVTLGKWLRARLMSGVSLSEYARRIGKAKSTLSEWMRMTDLVEPLQREVSDGSIPFHYALKIARMDLTPEEQGVIAIEAQEGGFEAVKASVDRIAAGREKRGAPRGLKVIRINFGMDSRDYDVLFKKAEGEGMKLSDYCLKILTEHAKGR